MEGEGTTMGGEVSVVAALARLARAERENRERLSALERQNRRMKGVIVGMLVCVAAVGTMAAWQPKVVVANEFVLRDKQGRPRARLGFTDDPDCARLGFYDRKGKCRVRLGFNCYSEEAELSFYDRKGKVGVELGLEAYDDRRDAWLQFCDAWGDGQVCLDMDDWGAGLWITDESLRERASIGYSRGYDGHPGEAWTRVLEQPKWWVRFNMLGEVAARSEVWEPPPPPGRVTISAVQGQGGSIELRDTNGNPAWGAP